MFRKILLRLFLLWLLSTIIVFLLFFFFKLNGVYGQSGTEFVIYSVIIGIPVSILLGVCLRFIKLMKQGKDASKSKILSCTFYMHKYGDPIYLQEGSCKRKQVCKYCKTEMISEGHHWSKWKYLNNSSLAGLDKADLSLRTLISKRVNLQEVKDFCFDVDIDYDNLRGEIEIDRIGSLIDLYNQKRSIPKFISQWIELRPDLSDDFDEFWKDTNIHDPSVGNSESELCDKARICSRCNSKEYKEIHFWGDEIQDKNVKCKYYKKCERCDIEDIMEPKHEYREHKDRDNPCDLMEKCVHCGDINTYGQDHKFETISEDLEGGSAKKIEECTRCGHKHTSWIKRN